MTYRQKLGNYAPTYWAKLQSSYEKALRQNIPNIVLIGDFNGDPSSDLAGATNLNDFVSLNNLHHHIFDPTRVVPGESETRLDLILTNLPQLVLRAGVGTPVHYNDHRTIYGTLNMTITRRKAFTRNMWLFKEADFDNYRDQLSNTNWDLCFESNNIDTICDTWTKTFLDISRNNIPNKDVTVRVTDKSWYTTYLRRLRRSKDRYYHIAIESKGDIDWNRYKAAKSHYFLECDRVKLEYEESKYASLASDIDKNPRKWWSLVSETMGTKKTTNYPTMIKNDIMYVTDKEKAEVFNQTYLESATLDLGNDDIDLGDNTPDHDLLSHIIVKEQDVRDILISIDPNKAYGPDGISPRLIKEAGTSIVNVLTRLFNRSLELAIFPLTWKRANVLPIYKKEEEFITTNYRPVSLLSILAKVFEKIVFKYLFTYFKNHFMISIWQSGFLPGSSTITQLTELYDQFCKAVNDGKEIRVVFLDISKAFDRVWHKGLLHKLRGCGISGKLLEWLKNYLSDRQQRVVINGESSQWGNINAGVPQGSVLGPLLFLIFINDITHVIRHCKIRLFADDTCLFIEVDDPGTMADLIDEDLKSISQWADKWKVTFSPPKTKELVISNKRNKPNHPVIKLDDVPITRVDNHKHLGLTLSNDLTWKTHVEEITDKANRRLGILRTLKYKLNRISLERIYKSMVRPILEYGDIVWHNTSQCMNSLEKVQLNAARIVVGATAKCSTQGLYNETKWETLAQRRAFHRMTLFYKIRNGIAPQYLLDMAPGLVQNRTQYRLRNTQNIDIPRTRINAYTNSFFPSAARLWNELCNTLKNLPSVESFKYMHSSKLPKPNPLFYYGGRLEAAIHARLRINNSPLRAHLCNHLNVIDSPLCPCGSGQNETPKHYFFECQLYDQQRRALKSNLLPLVINRVDHLLFGVPGTDHLDNIQLFEAVHQFIRDTMRFY